MQLNPTEKDLLEKLQHKIDNKTKPIAALGVLEDLAVQVGMAQRTLNPVLRKPHLIVFAADHGIANSGVSAYPQEVTFQMLQNFLSGGAAVNVLAKENGIELMVVDAGVNHEFDISQNKLINKKTGRGTASFLTQNAMSEQQLEYCLDSGSELIEIIHQQGCNVVGFGEMGIGNTSSASMLMSYLCDLPIDECIGRGTGLDDQQLEQKLNILKEARAFHGPITDPLAVLQAFGGFEIAQMSGAMISAMDKEMIILVDGFIATAAFLAIYSMRPEIIKNAIFCHLSDESGHQILLDYLGVNPMLDLRMCLGEGTGCALAYPILKSAVAILNNMASFEEAGVSQKTKS